MSLSKIAICNLALAALGAESIRSFDEEKKQARMAQVFFEPARNYLLAKFDWPFARKFAKLQQLVDYETPEGVYAYQMPSDCETPRDMFPQGSKDWWEVNGDVLLCKKPSEVYLYYTATEVDTAKFTSTFSMLLAGFLAVKMGPAITQDKDMVAALYEQFQAEQRDCWEADANVGNDYRTFDEDPNNDPFVNPTGNWESEDYGRI